MQPNQMNANNQNTREEGDFLLQQLINSSKPESLQQAQKFARETLATMTPEERAASVPCWEKQAEAVTRRTFKPDTMGAYYVLVAHYCAQFAADFSEQ